MSTVMADALARLERLLPERAPELQASLRPPASEQDIAALRDAVSPYEPPAELLELLRWADGQEDAWWPVINCGPLLSARAAARHYGVLLSFDEPEFSTSNPLLLPVARAGHWQAVVEMGPPGQGAVIDASFPDPQVRVIAPSLSALMHASADLLEAGAEEPTGAPDPAASRAWMTQRDEAIARRSDQAGWQAWPYDRVIPTWKDAWPPRWRVAAGLPPLSPVPYRPPRPLAAVLAEAREGSVAETVEGHVLDRALPGRTARDLALVTFGDASARVHLPVPREMRGSHQAAWIGWRLQVDLLAGEEAARDALRMTLAAGDGRFRPPDGDYAIPLAIRHAQQGRGEAVG